MAINYLDWRNNIFIDDILDYYTVNGLIPGKEFEKHKNSRQDNSINTLASTRDIDVYPTGSKTPARAATTEDALKAQKNYYDSTYFRSDNQNALNTILSNLNYSENLTDEQVQNILDIINEKISRARKWAMNKHNQSYGTSGQRNENQNFLDIYSHYNAVDEDQLDKLGFNTHNRIPPSFLSLKDHSDLRDGYKLSGYDGNIWIDNAGYFRTGEYGKGLATPEEEPKLETPPGQVIPTLSANWKPTPFLKEGNFDKWFPKIIEGSRLWLALNNNKRVHDIYNKAIKPTLLNSYERYSPITGDYATMSAKNQEAADLLRNTQNQYTTDQSKNQGLWLSAQINANKLRTEGRLADNQHIEQTAKEGLARQEDNTSRWTNVANTNRLSISEAIERRAENDALLSKKNFDSWNEYLKGWEQDARDEYDQKKQYIETFNDKIVEDNANLKFGEYEKYLNAELYRITAEVGATGNVLNNPEYIKVRNNLLKLIEYKNDYIAKQTALRKNIPYNGMYSDENTDQFLKSLISSKRLGGSIIPKFWSGGNMNNYYSVFDLLPRRQPNLAQRAAAEANEGKSKKSESNEPVSQKEIFELVKNLKGLPNDVQIVTNYAMNAMQTAYLTGDPTATANIYMNLIPSIAQIEHNYKEFENAYNQAVKHNNLQDYAFDDLGNLYTLNTQTGEIEHQSFNEWKKNRESGIYRPLNVANVLQLRYQNPKFANNNQMITTAFNSVNLDQIDKQLRESFKELGSSKQSFNGYTNSAAAQGYEELQKYIGAGPQGYYEIKQSMTQSNSQMQATLKYMITMLPREMKNRLLFETQNGTMEEVIDIVAALITGTANTEQSTEIDFLGMNPKSSKSGDGSDKGTKPKATFLTSIQGSYGGEKRTLIYGTDNFLFKVNGSYYGAFLDSEGKAFTATNLQDFLTQTGLSGISDPSAISFGDNQIPVNALSKVSVENKGGSYAILPCKYVNGKPVPDFELLNKYQKIIESVDNQMGKLNPNASEEQQTEYGIKKQKLIAKKLKETPELQQLVTSADTIDQSKFCGFFILDGLAADNTFELTGIDKKSGQRVKLNETNNSLMSKTKDENDINYYKLTTGQKDWKDTRVWMDVFGSGDLYKSNIFIPITNTNRLAGILFSGQEIDENIAMRINTEYLTSKINVTHNTGQLLSGK